MSPNERKLLVLVSNIYKGALLPMPHDIRCPRNLQYCPPNESKLLVLVLVLVPNIYKGVVAKIALSPVGRIV